MDIKEPYFLRLTRDEQRAALEALIFASDEALSTDTLFKILITRNYSIKEASAINEEEENDSQFSFEKEIKERFSLNDDFFRSLINEINEDLSRSGRPYEIVEIAGGYQFATRREYGEVIRHLVNLRKKKRLSQAALETIAIVAYRQPITKPEVEQIRGVNSSEIMNSLLDKNLVKIVGRKDSLGKPLLYATTNEFLRVFGLKRLEDLPKLRELEEIATEDIGRSGDQITINAILDEDSGKILKKIRHFSDEGESEIIEEEEPAEEDQEDNYSEN